MRVVMLLKQLSKQKNKRIPSTLLSLVFGLLVSLGSLLAVADGDPPGRVGRISYIDGSVQIYNRDTSAWEDTSINRPITSGDALHTTVGSRAELRIGGTAIRLDSDSEIQVAQLDDAHCNIQLDQGRAAVHLGYKEDINGFSLNTAEGQFYATQPGSYGFESHPNTSSATAWRGTLQFRGNNAATTVIQGGNRIDFLNMGNGISMQPSSPVLDDFSSWVAGRVQADDNATVQYVSPQMTGAEDLQTYGSWENTADDSQIWYPANVAVSWAPYRYGHWAWIAPWGWSWVDDAPWGFAPFHYGRWVQRGARWGWMPGTYVARPVYAPALVAWVGGSGFSISSGASVGWFPLGPHEVYVPGYHVSPAYIRNVNITHVTNITNITTIVNNPQSYIQNNHYAYRNSPGAVTVVPRAIMANRQPVAAAVVPIRDNQWRQMGNVPLTTMPDAARPTNNGRNGNNRMNTGNTVVHPAPLNTSAPHIGTPNNSMPNNASPPLPTPVVRHTQDSFKDADQSRQINHSSSSISTRSTNQAAPIPASPPGLSSQRLYDAPGSKPVQAHPEHQQQNSQQEIHRQENRQPASPEHHEQARPQRAAPQKHENH